ncbi:hypothetical protein F4859DRAFT_10006 [Xylaria cf. heliscus]|nr:hypothetical protein F4859DRAFT_10006 [Xylaria cf. heliscus]
MALTNLGPLPTSFAFKADCTRDLGDVYKYYTTQGSYYLLQGPVEQTSCFPSGYTANSKQYYSPGRCPTGFTSACKSESSSGSVVETVMKCCPTQSKFACRTKASHPWEETLGCVIAQETTSTTTWTVTQVSGGQTAAAATTYMDAAGGVNAYQVQVGIGRSTFTTKAANGVSGSSSSSRKKHRKKTKLGAGVIAGIVVGTLAGLAIFVGIVWFVVRGKKNKQRQKLEDDADATATRDKPDDQNELSDQSTHKGVGNETHERENAALLGHDVMQPVTDTRR